MIIHAKLFPRGNRERLRLKQNLTLLHCETLFPMATYFALVNDVHEFGLGSNNPYTGSLEARVKASNKERVYGLVRPNHEFVAMRIMSCNNVRYQYS